MTEQEQFDVVTEVRIMKHDMKTFEGKIEKHIEQGERWRMAIILALLGLVGQVFQAVYFNGQINNRICRTEQAIDKIIMVLEKTNDPIISR